MAALSARRRGADSVDKSDVRKALFLAFPSHICGWP